MQYSVTPRRQCEVPQRKHRRPPATRLTNHLPIGQQNVTILSIVKFNPGSIGGIDFIYHHIWRIANRHGIIPRHCYQIYAIGVFNIIGIWCQRHCQITIDQAAHPEPPHIPSQIVGFSHTCPSGRTSPKLQITGIYPHHATGKSDIYVEI